MKRLSYRNRRGYTLAEMLITVVILMVLLGISLPFLFNIRKEMKQTALDAKAEIIYTAAQNRLSKLKAAGNVKAYKPLSGTGASILPGVPSDAADEDAVKEGDIYFFSSIGGKISNNVINEKTVEIELLNNHWVVEYNPRSATVYAVFYSEGEVDCAYEYLSDYSKYDTSLRWKEDRIKDGARVGYYGGGSASSGNVTALNPKLIITNAEKLTADITCSLPAGVPLGQNLVFKVEIEDSFKNKYTKYYTPGIGRVDENKNGYEVDITSMKVVGRKHSLELILDDLSSYDTRFDMLYGEGSGHDTDGYGNGTNSLLVPGADLQITVSVSCPGNYKLTQNAVVSSETNSLFYFEEGLTEISAESSSNIAYINCGRHLQNLDQSSGVLAGISLQKQKAHIAHAVQTSDIIFYDSEILEEVWDWQETYGSSYFNGMCSETGTPNFKPIHNNELLSYGGSHLSEGVSAYYRIIGLTESVDAENAFGIEGLGLFDKIGRVGAGTSAGGSGIMLKDITMTGTKLFASGTDVSSGAIAGSVNGIVTISHCQVFLTENDIKDKTNANVWISGKNAGGLVGITESGASLNIRSSAASTVIGAYTYEGSDNERLVYPSNKNAGGLIGCTQPGCSVSINESYADSYLVGENAGGLIALSEGFVTVRNSYAAGFVTANDMAAGLVLGYADTAFSYTLVSELDMGSMDDSKAAYFRTCMAGPANGSVFYSVSNSLGLTDLVEYPENLHRIGDLTTGEYTIESMTDALNAGGSQYGDAFTIDTSASRPYNLMYQGLTTYTYPSLYAVVHYGDWSADFQVGALVYYEKYLPAGNFDENGQADYNAVPIYGFYGANVESTLIDDPAYIVVGDGYGVVYGRSDDNLPESIEVTITDKGDESWSGITQEIPVRAAHDYESRSVLPLFYEVTGTDGEIYDIYPFAREMVNTEHGAYGYYLRAEIKASTGSAANYYFNPHFASSKNANNIVLLADPRAASPKLTADSNVVVRTPRHLYNMSLYYPVYANATAEACYLQERNIDYREYEWALFSLRQDSCRVQRPIGLHANGDCTAFTSGFEGGFNWITNVSFACENGSYAGFIADNGGTISNVVLKVVYNPGNSDNYYVQRSGDVRDTSLSIGTLAGSNSGKITNCAVSGYFLAGSDGTIHAYENSTINAGGFVGSNTGSIANCSADIPKIRLSATYANVNLGGFTGSNRGSVNDCYDLGYLEVADSRGGSIESGGFAGFNSGIIHNSYCATAMSVSGENAESYGFAPFGGSIYGCDYLNKGSYSYIGRLLSFNYAAKDSCADERSYHYMVKIGNWHSATYSYNFNNTNASQDHYPFRAVVRDSEYHLVHYGDWLDDEKLGDVGVFYWEREEGGSNNGIHFTYLGADKNGSLTGTSLCNAHDDGGIITEYGYGYFEKNAGSIVNIEVSGMNYSGPTNGYVAEFIETGSRGENVEVSKAIRDQVNATGENRDFYFYAYRTRKLSETDQNDEDNKDYLCMNGTDANGTWTLTYRENNTEEEKSYKFEISPFFANSMRVMSGIDSSVSIKSEDGKVTDYKKLVGSSENQYEIRSIQQLQYINWNNDKYNTKTLIEADGSNKGYYTYLPYTSQNGTATESKATALNNTKRYWLQTHDLNADEVSDYVPIAGQSLASDNTAYNAMLYTWFGGSYDGQSYKISELRFRSPSVTVGLFGVTAGAEIKNVILYSENDAFIERKTDSADRLSSYALGGLIGVAYDYGTAGENKITNCAIAGYRIIDNSRNQQGRGEANVGGLIGVANVGVERCSSVVDIEINCTHKNAAGQFTTASWGNYVRVGGIAGAAQMMIKDCYSGGSIKVGKETLEENNNSSSVKVDTASSGTVDHQKSTNIYAAGICGSGFAMNYQNFTGNGSLKEGNPYIENCYTYMKFPAFEGTIRSISIIGSVADRYNQGPTITISNCYYLDSIAEIDMSSVPAFSISGGGGSVKSILEKDDYLEDMLMGNSRFVGKMMIDAEKNRLTAGSSLEAKTYDELKKASELLGKDWKSVTATEGTDNLRVDGKYSFAAGNRALEGKNYPFPTIITRKDAIHDRTVHVHYGSWIINGPYWSEGRSSMDVFKDMSFTGSSNGYAEKVFRLDLNKTAVQYSPADKDSYEIQAASPIAEIVSASKIAGSAGDSVYAVTVRALRTGTTVISLKDTDASFTLEITADAALIASPSTMTIAEGQSDELIMYAVTDLGNKITKIEALSNNLLNYETDERTEWSICPDAEDILTITSGDKNTKNRFNTVREAAGDVLLSVNFKYHYGHDTAETGIDVHKSDVEIHKYVSVFQPDTIGISDGISKYNSAAVQKETYEGIVNARSTTYASDPPKTEEGDFFLYLHSSDSAANIEDLEINEIRINGTPAAKNEQNTYQLNTDSGILCAEISTESVKDSKYQYLAGRLFRMSMGDNEQAPVEEAALSVILTYKGVQYDLPLTLSSVETRKMIKVTYQDENDENEPYIVGVWSGSYKLITDIPAGWKVKEAGTVITAWKNGTAEYHPGDTVNITGDMTFTAGWGNLVVHLNANTGRFPEILDGLEETTITEDRNEASVKLEVNDNISFRPEYYEPEKNGYSLGLYDGSRAWTDKNGNEFSRYSGFNDEQLIESGRKFTANWYMNVRLSANGGRYEDEETNDSLEQNSYVTLSYGKKTVLTENGSDVYCRMVRSGYRLMGWSIDPDDSAAIVLKADESEAETVFTLERYIPGYTDAEGNWICETDNIPVVLYAQWKPARVIIDVNSPTGSGSDVVGIDTEMQEGIYADRLSEIEDPKCAGYLFAGWAADPLESDPEKLFSLNEILTEALLTWDENDTAAVYARWYGKEWSCEEPVDGNAYALVIGGSALIHSNNKISSIPAADIDEYEIDHYWYVTSSGDSLKLHYADGKKTYYLKHNTGYLIFGDSLSAGTGNNDSSWDYADNALFYSRNESTYYLRYVNGFGVGEVTDESQKTISFMAKKYNMNQLLPNGVSSLSAIAYSEAPEVFMNFDPVSEELPEYKISLILDDEVYQEVKVQGKVDAVSEYTEPQRNNRDWKLEGWYTSPDQNGEKVLEADGTAIQSFELNDDIALYAGWCRELTAFVKTKKAESGEYLLIDRSGNSEGATAIGQISSDADVLYRQNVELLNETHLKELGITFSEDEFDNRESIFVIDVPEILIWQYSDFNNDDYANAFYNTVTGVCIDQSLFDENEITLFRKVKAKQLSFEEASLKLILANEKEGKEISLRIDEDGTLHNWSFIYEKPLEPEDNEFHGWYLLPEQQGAKVFDQDGSFFDEYISWLNDEGETVLCVEDGRWVYQHSILVLYEGWDHKDLSEAKKDEKDNTEEDTEEDTEEKDSEEEVSEESESTSETESESTFDTESELMPEPDSEVSDLNDLGSDNSDPLPDDLSESGTLDEPEDSALDSSIEEDENPVPHQEDQGAFAETDISMNEEEE